MALFRTRTRRADREDDLADLVETLTHHPLVHSLGPVLHLACSFPQPPLVWVWFPGTIQTILKGHDPTY